MPGCRCRNHIERNDEEMKLIDGDKLYDALADKLSWLMG